MATTRETDRTIERRTEPQDDQPVVAAWFDATYRSRGFAYLRPFEAYPIFLQLLGVRAGERLLDVGCGPGLLLRAALMRELRPTGVDISAAAVEIARVYARGAEVVQGNAESLDQPDATFHHVTCIGALERVLDRGRALAEMRRVARDDARFCIMVRNSATLGWSLWNRLLRRRNVRGHQDALTLDEWRRLFADNGLQEQAVYVDQWLRQRVRKVLRGFRRHDFRRPEPVAGPILPLRFANEFVFVLEKAR